MKTITISKSEYESLFNEINKIKLDISELKNIYSEEFILECEENRKQKGLEFSNKKELEKYLQNEV